ncbi:hypothetical protein AJ78_01923 [Emergomyces pasteurianus Ep9510]|uniref:Uncharacterized protein n=1 Tax=Emergomyces pasteurianus Ep9510 TaxID=1447872 RepID=A0A1J9QPC7_9EURO|nr:hypothetical protein AJ78_01923 [Emergomyces pasteurianus Ep9510]
MGGMFVPYLDACHEGEYSPETRREIFDAVANCRYPKKFDETAATKQPQNGESSSRYLQLPGPPVKRVTRPTIKKEFETEECWRFGDFISTNYGSSDTHEPPKGKKRKCQIVQYRQHSSIESMDGPPEVAKLVNLSRPAKPQLVTILRSSSSRTSVPGKAEASDLAQEFMVFERLSSLSNSLSLSSSGGQSSRPCDDSGYVTQDSYSSNGDISPLSPDCRTADASPGLLRRQFSFKSQIPRWIQKTSPLHKNHSSFGSAVGSYSSPSTPTPTKFPLRSPASSAEAKKALTAKSWSMAWAVDHLETSIMRSPPDLTLSSPVIIFVRSTTQTTLLHPFQDIFPSAPIEKLSSLCAAFVAQLYLSSLETSEHTNRSPIMTSHVMDGFSDKARARLGIHLSKMSQLRVKERLLRTRGADICVRLDEIVDKLLVDICGTSDSSLKGALMALVQALEGNKSSDSSGHCTPIRV